MIFHLGDIGAPEILAELEKIASLVAIRGNHEPSSLLHIPRVQSLELQGVRILLSHGFISVDRKEARLIFPHFFERLKAERIKIVLFGHTHCAEAYEEDGVVFANPGYAGAPIQSQPRSTAILTLKSDEGRLDFIYL